MLGGPIARYLTRKLKTPGLDAPHTPQDRASDTCGFEHPKEQHSMTPTAFIKTLALFAIAPSGGTAIESLIRGTAFELPILVLLVAQTALMVVYAIFATFRLMGSNYDAAVLAAGHCGFGLGATPTAIANMQAVTARFGPSHMAFLIVPMVRAFFIEIANALVIKLFLALPIYG